LNYTVKAERTLDTLERLRAAILDYEQSRDQPMRCVANGDSARFGGGLNPRRDVWRVAEDVGIATGALSHHYRPRIDADPRGEFCMSGLLIELRDRTLFWNRGDLERKLDNYQAYYNQHRCHTGLAGATPAERSGVPAQPIAKLEYTWLQHCNGLFQTPTPA
jgi:hypothetical protein